MYRLLISGWLLLGASYPQEQTPEVNAGSICGTVINETGAPAALTGVTAIYVGGAHTGPYPSARTDQGGRYCVTNIQPGEYAMSASDPEKGYPMLGSLFYALHAPEPRIRIAPETLHAHLDWQIPYKAGFLRVRLTDLSTGIPIKVMSTELSFAGDSLRYMHGSEYSNQVLLVPPNERVFLKVTAPGYDSWPEGESQGRLVDLLPGQEETLSVSLRPKVPQPGDK